MSILRFRRQSLKRNFTRNPNVLRRFPIYDFVCGLIGAETPEECDMISYGLQDELESPKDEFEEVLANHGIVIHRPVIVDDEDAISDYISDVTGWCHRGFAIEEILSKQRGERLLTTMIGYA